jgi:hypothetical protein
VLAPGRRELELDIYVLVLGGLALLVLVSGLREIAGAKERSPLEEALATPPRRPQRPRELERLEREVSFAASTEFDLHFRLRPLVRDIATARLERRGQRLETSAEELGDELWELVRPDREPPGQRHAAGPGVAGVKRMVERLERL